MKKEETKDNHQNVHQGKTDAEEKISPSLDEEKTTAEEQKSATAPQSSIGREQDLINTLQRLQAEFENYKKRIDREQDEFRKRANEDMLTKLLDIVDTFELVIVHGKASADKDLLKGVELSFAQLTALLEAQGIVVINPLGKQFSPHTSEALITQASDKPKGTVIEVFQKGYTLAGKVIRHARVKVAQ